MTGIRIRYVPVWLATAIAVAGACGSDTDYLAEDPSTGGVSGSIGEAGGDAGGATSQGGAVGRGGAPSGGSGGFGACAPVGTFCDPTGVACCGGSCDDIGLAEPV